MKNITTKDLALNALFGATYVALGFIFQFLAFDAIQFRIAEAILVLLIFNKRLAPGMILGTFIFNLFSPFGIIDALVGTLASILAISLIILLRRLKSITFIFPALFNGLLVGWLITYTTETPFLFNFTTVFLGELVVMYTIGLLLYLYIDKNENIKELITDNIKD